jgi:hypothetical protein
MVDKPSGNPTNSGIIECGLEKDRLGADDVAKGERPVGLAYTGRRVSSLVPWGDSEESETVGVSQDVVNRRGEGGWEGEGVGEGVGGGEGGGEGEGEGEGEGGGEGEGEDEE